AAAMLDLLNLWWLWSDFRMVAVVWGDGAGGGGFRDFVVVLWLCCIGLWCLVL
ncbi:Hypothetical predicted protein, partial [Olea europaea subsp. europaea]